jgi:hypothetical protein
MISWHADQSPTDTRHSTWPKDTVSKPGRTTSITPTMPTASATILRIRMASPRNTMAMTVVMIGAANSSEADSDSGTSGKATNHRIMDAA